MSKISVNIKHRSMLWTMHEEAGDLRIYSHELDAIGTKVTFFDAGMTVACDVQLDDFEKDALLSCLVKDSIYFIPHWQNLTVDVHRTVQRIESKLMEVVRVADYGFRRISKGIRLPPVEITKAYLNSNQGFEVMNWELSIVEQEKLDELIFDFSPVGQEKYKRGIVQIPLSISFGQKHIRLDENEVKTAFGNMKEEESIPPFWTLYGLAWENFSKNRSHDAAILVLATSIETALKWCLSEYGDSIAKYLIENVQSPPLRKLYECACENTTLDFPSHYSSWLQQLSNARNFVAHKPRGFELDLLLIGRWFAVGEAILNAIIGNQNEPLVGYLVKPIGKHASEKFPEDSRAVVLRRERFNKADEEKLHVLMDTGETYYFSESAFEKLPEKSQKFPDIK